MTNPNQDSLLGGAQAMNWGKDPSPWMSSREQPKWRGGTVLEPLTETQQRDFDKGTPLFWDDGVNGMMQICASVQTAERDGGEFDDGIRTMYIKKNGSAPGSMFGELKRAVASAGGGLGPGCQIYFALVGTEASKKRGGMDRRIYICHFKPMPPAGDQMLQGPEPGQQGVSTSPPAPQPNGSVDQYANYANAQAARQQPPQYQSAQQTPQGPPPGYAPQQPQGQPVYAQQGPPNGQPQYQQQGPPPGYAPQQDPNAGQQYQSPPPPQQQQQGPPQNGQQPVYPY